MPLDEWKGNVETISDRTRKALLEYQIKVGREGGRRRHGHE